MNAMAKGEIFGRQCSPEFLAAMEREQARAREARSAPLSDGPTGPWMVVMTKAGKERPVHDRLVKDGFEVFLPLRPVRSTEARARFGVVSTPFLPRMLFVRATMDAERWQLIFHTVGVARVLCDPSSPKGVRHDFIERLRARSLDAFLAIGLVDPNRPPKAIRDPRKWSKLGDVMDGLFAEGVDERRKSVLLSLLDEGHNAVTRKISRQ